MFENDCWAECAGANGTMYDIDTDSAWTPAGTECDDPDGDKVIHVEDGAARRRPMHVALGVFLVASLGVFLSY